MAASVSRTGLKRVGQLLLLAALYAAANGLAGWFQVQPGLSILFPATAVAVVTCMWFGWWGAAAVAAATLLTPWSATNSTLLFGFAALNAAEGMIPALVFRSGKRLDPALADGRSMVAFLVAGVVANTAVSALGGSVLLALSAAGPSSFATTALVWWFADAIASFTLAVPALMLFTAAVRRSATGTLGARAASAWREHGRTFLVLALLLAAATLVLEFTGRHAIGFFHWFAVLFFAPLLYAALRLGLRGGVAAAGLVSLLYIATVAGGTALSGTGVRDRVLTIYFNILSFSLAGVTIGVLADSERRLTNELRGKNTLLKYDFLRTIRALAAALDAKDPSSSGHHRRVAENCEAVGAALAMDEESLEMLRYASELHDIGRIAIPEGLLRKPGPLDAAEQALMRGHVEAGVRILGSVELLAGALPALASHHERWDGATSGPFAAYPGLLRGEAIPLAARVLQVADAWDAMISDQPYRAAFSPGRALQVLLEESGKQFDGRVVEAFLDVVSRRSPENAALVAAARAARPL